MGCDNHSDAKYNCFKCAEVVRSKLKEFPLQSSRHNHGPPSIPWILADKAWLGYAARYGREQSVERIAERGGFGWTEMDAFYPNWRNEIGEALRFTEGLKKIVEASTLSEAKAHALALMATIDGKKVL